ncbi:DDE-type integrase/transposase/recombinase [Reticulibacter mediterranei]|uniref:DDE-type integrase/transposase/recombinase n=1 Tax=Reticulibacter mediterranei TaxID=2778369 RepID=UPI001C693E57|nr:DDE-type integrase/transposase/recombinase [Reticulibacter mediterranei]
MGQRYDRCLDGGGWLCAVVILDLFVRLVVGWAMGETNDEELVRNALEMALAHPTPPAEMLLHSDQNSPIQPPTT